jgi:hypothetical protein
MEIGDDAAKALGATTLKETAAGVAHDPSSSGTVLTQAAPIAANAQHNSTASTPELLTLKPTLWPGVSVDLKELWRRYGFKVAAFIPAVVFAALYFGKSASLKDSTAQNPQCLASVRSHHSSFTNNSRVLGDGACLDSHDDTFLGNGSVAGSTGGR